METPEESPSPELRGYQEVDDLEQALKRYEGEIIRRCYEREGSSIKVARALNISQTTAARKIRKYVKTCQKDA